MLGLGEAPHLIMKRFLDVLGSELRAARLRAGLRLREVGPRTRNAFKASAVGGYERGERSISVERLCQLAEVYGARPDAILASALSQLEGQASRDVVVHLDPIDGNDPTPLALLARDIARMRRVSGDGPLTIRATDLEAFHSANG